MQLSIVIILLCFVAETITAPTKDVAQDIELALKNLINERGIKTPPKPSKKKKDKDLEPPEEQESPNTLESDMKLTSEQLDLVKENMVEANGNSRTRGANDFQKRKAILDVKYRWPKNMVPYILDASLSVDYERGILEAMKHIEDRTCIRFYPYSEKIAQKVGHTARVRIHKGIGCYSDVGKRGDGEQEVSIGNGCNLLGTIVHELMHTLGLYHEQSRPDRDEHLKIHDERINSDNLFNFEKYGHSEVKNFGVPYDYGSVMHYKGTYFAKTRGAITMETVDPRMQNRIGQRAKMSFIDTMVINEMYHCNEHCSDAYKTCENQGYIGPDCNCVCPDGLAGQRCTDVATTASPCGEVFNDMTGSITSPSYPNAYGESRDCNWLIQGPPGSTITLNFDDFFVEEDGDACRYDYLEVRSRGPHHAGPRYCGSGPQSPVVYNGTSLILQLHSDDDWSERGFKLTYSIDQSSRVDGQWSAWQAWTQCHKTCGLAHKLRVRYCNNPAPQNGGKDCEGEDIEFATCGLPPC